MKELGFGILGAGLVSPFHCKSVKASRGGKLIAICDMSRERADKLAAEYGVKAYYDLAGC
jgi:predicted dehydrogenase